MTYTTPGVFVQEIPSFPPSVVQVATAIPAFIGYTKLGNGSGNSPTVARINSLLEYQSMFGTASASKFSFTATSLTNSNAEVALDPSGEDLLPDYLLYYAISLYFLNGGGSCYVISLGSYPSTGIPDVEDFKNGLSVLAQEDEPTLIVFPDAVKLAKEQYSLIAQTALNQCHTLGDRFLLLDVTKNLPTDAFRDGIASDYLSYAAAYYPYLSTTLTPIYDEALVTIHSPVQFVYSVPDKLITITYSGAANDEPSVTIVSDPAANPIKFELSEKEKPPSLTIKAGVNATIADLASSYDQWAGKTKSSFKILASKSDATALPLLPKSDLTIESGMFRWQSDTSGIEVRYTGKASEKPSVSVKVDENLSDIQFEVSNAALTIKTKSATSASEIAQAWTKAGTPEAFVIEKLRSGNAVVSSTADPVLLTLQNPVTLAVLQTLNTALYNKVKLALNNIPVVLPPSAAIAGIYARVDRDRGVWKTPANVPVLGVIGPVTKISDSDQELLNVDVSGKSINAIRAFAGKGTLVWGGRTLLGNDNEWRYISVRRLFITIEESARKATAFAVFEPNDATTWLKVKAMIESYLYGLWEQGALAGAKPEAAFFVNVGLGKTMTPQDVLEGRMIVRIGIAAVRPAEFIILQFTHKLQEA